MNSIRKSALISAFAFCVQMLLGPLYLAAQSVFVLSNHILDENLNAPVYASDGSPLAGPQYSAQLYLGLERGSLKPILPATTFLTGAGAGYFVGGFVIATNIPGGLFVWAEVRAWDNRLGSTFEEAFSKQIGGYGSSKDFQVTSAPFGGPHPPAILQGLESFRLVPEPGTIALFVVGALQLILLQSRLGSRKNATTSSMVSLRPGKTSDLGLPCAAIGAIVEAVEGVSPEIRTI